MTRHENTAPYKGKAGGDSRSCIIAPTYAEAIDKAIMGLIHKRQSPADRVIEIERLPNNQWRVRL